MQNEKVLVFQEYITHFEGMINAKSYLNRYAWKCDFSMGYEVHVLDHEERSLLVVTDSTRLDGVFLFPGTQIKVYTWASL